MGISEPNKSVSVRDLLVNLRPCLQPKNDKQLAEQPKKNWKKNLEPARKGLGEVFLCLDEACKGDGEETILEVSIARRLSATTSRTISPRPCLLSEEVR